MIKPVAIAIAALAIAPLSHADFKEDARKVYSEVSPAIYGIKGILKLDVTLNGQQAANQEINVWSNGAEVSDGLLAVSYMTLIPDVSTNLGPGAKGLEISTELTELRVINQDGEEFEAKLVLHDEDLGLAFIALSPAGENVDSWITNTVKIPETVKVQHLDDVVVLGRHSQPMRYQGIVKQGQVTSMVSKPKHLIDVDGIKPGEFAFAADGSLTGIAVAITAASQGKDPQAMVLASTYITKLIGEAKEKQNALSTEADSE